VRRAAPNNPSMGRTHAFDGLAGMTTPGLRGAWKRSAMLRANLFGLSLSCFARKASDLSSWQIPLVACDEPLICTPPKRNKATRFECTQCASMIEITP
jgi:hypothetical protein